MRVLVLGGNGLAGHVIVNYLQNNLSKDLYFSIREKSNNPQALQLDLTNDELLQNYLIKMKPEIVINAAAILNQDAEKNIIDAIYINSFLPHQLARYGHELGFKVIHISSDGVFSGEKGSYTEDDEKDATSIYAMTKNLGEVVDEKHVTIRTSIIGPEIRNQGIGLFHWFMKQSGKIQGFKEVYWNGVTSLELAKAIVWIIQKDITGLVQLTGDRISKHDLLVIFKEEFNRTDLTITPNYLYKKDNTLINTRKDFQYKAPSLKAMIKEKKQWIEDNPNLYSHYIKDALKGGE